MSSPELDLRRDRCVGDDGGGDGEVEGYKGCALTLDCGWMLFFGYNDPVLDILVCGDVESSPGPVDFARFKDGLVEVFFGSVGSVVLGRALTYLLSKKLLEGWDEGLFAGVLGVDISRQDGMRVLAGNLLYTSFELKVVSVPDQSGSTGA